MAMHPTSKRSGTPRLPIAKQFIRPNIRSSSRKETVASPRPVNGAAPPVNPATINCAASGSAKKPSEAPLPSQPWPDLRKERMVSVKEAAYRAMKSEDTIYQWLRAGRLKGCQPGGQGCNVLVSEASLKEVLRCATRFGK